MKRWQLLAIAGALVVLVVVGWLVGSAIYNNVRQAEFDACVEQLGLTDEQLNPTTFEELAELNELLTACD